jgi:uncharacterized protein CbrC (UPF0167 family)
LLAVAVATAVAFPGCASVETRRGYFRDDRERCVGEVIGDPATWWCGWDDVAAVRATADSTDEYEIVPAGMGECRWIYVVDRDTGRVSGWRYAGDPADCYIRIDWLGAW